MIFNFLLTMHKHYLLLIILLFISTASYSQTYTFDYMLEYNYRDLTDTVETQTKPKPGTLYRFINSKSNACYMNVRESKGKTQMQPTLETGKFYLSSMPTEDFFVEGISMKCPYFGFVPPSDKKFKDFEFITKADTIINTERFKHYVLNPINEKKFKKGEITIEHYIIDNSLNLTIPIVLGQSLSHQFWEKGTKLPNGILKEVFGINAEGKKTFEQKLVQALPIKKIIIIDNSKCK